MYAIPKVKPFGNNNARQEKDIDVESSSSKRSDTQNDENYVDKNSIQIKPDSKKSSVKPDDDNKKSTLAWLMEFASNSDYAAVAASGSSQLVKSLAIADNQFYQEFCYDGDDKVGQKSRDRQTVSTPDKSGASVAVNVPVYNATLEERHLRVKEWDCTTPYESGYETMDLHSEESSSNPPVEMDMQTYPSKTFSPVRNNSELKKPTTQPLRKFSIPERRTEQKSPRKSSVIEQRPNQKPLVNERKYSAVELRSRQRASTNEHKPLRTSSPVERRAAQRSSTAEERKPLRKSAIELRSHQKSSEEQKSLRKSTVLEQRTIQKPSVTVEQNPPRKSSAIEPKTSQIQKPSVTEEQKSLRSSVIEQRPLQKPSLTEQKQSVRKYSVPAQRSTTENKLSQRKISATDQKPAKKPPPISNVSRIQRSTSLQQLPTKTSKNAKAEGNPPPFKAKARPAPQHLRSSTTPNSAASRKKMEESSTGKPKSKPVTGDHSVMKKSGKSGLKMDQPLFDFGTVKFRQSSRELSNSLNDLRSLLGIKDDLPILDDIEESSPAKDDSLFQRLALDQDLVERDQLQEFEKFEHEMTLIDLETPEMKEKYVNAADIESSTRGRSTRQNPVSSSRIPRFRSPSPQVRRRLSLSIDLQDQREDLVRSHSSSDLQEHVSFDEDTFKKDRCGTEMSPSVKICQPLVTGRAAAFVTSKTSSDIRKHLSERRASIAN